MDAGLLAGIALIVAVVAAGMVLLVLLRLGRMGEGGERLRLLAEQAVAGTRAEGDTTRALLASARLEAAEAAGGLRIALVREQGEARALLEAKLREMGEMSAASLAAIRKAVDEQLHQAVEKQMTVSFQRVADQFTQVQKAMADVQLVTAQIGDLKRVFSNVKSRGGWGETHLRALLDDILPGEYETNCRLTEGSAQVVEFAIRMPGRGTRVLLALDAKFPVEDYERLVLAAEAGDAVGEQAARKGLEARFRTEAKSISGKYIVPPVTADFAVMYLPTDGLYVEAARVPGLIDEIGKVHRVLIVGPSLCPALLRTIHLGSMALTIEARAKEVGDLLGATRAEMQKMDGVLATLAGHASKVSETIDRARVRTRQVERKLRSVSVAGSEEAGALLELEEE